MSRTVRALLLGAALLAAVVSFKALGQPRLKAGPRRPAPDVAAEYLRRCGNGETTPECAGLRGLVRYQAVTALEQLAGARDQRAVPSALRVLTLADEPYLQVEACRVLAQFPARPELKAALLPRLLGPYPAVQRAAAEVLRSSRDATAARLGEQWLGGHPRDAESASPYAEAAPPTPPSGPGFQPYPGARRYAPAEAPNAAAWLTPAPVADVVEFYRRQTGATPVDFTTWYARAQKQEQARFEAAAATMGKPGKDPDLMEIDRLGKEYQRTRNPALLRKIQEAGKRMSDRAEKLRATVDRSLAANDTGLLASYQRRLPSRADQVPLRTARFLVAEQHGARVTRLVVVYREDAVDQTVVQLLWAAPPTRE